MWLMWPKSAKVELFSTNLAEILVKVALKINKSKKPLKNIY
jgi:hypothetical protein